MNKESFKGCSLLHLNFRIVALEIKNSGPVAEIKRMEAENQ